MGIGGIMDKETAQEIAKLNNKINLVKCDIKRMESYKIPNLRLYKKELKRLEKMLDEM